METDHDFWLSIGDDDEQPTRRVATPPSTDCSFDDEFVRLAPSMGFSLATWNAALALQAARS